MYRNFTLRHSNLRQRICESCIMGTRTCIFHLSFVARRYAHILYMSEFTWLYSWYYYGVLNKLKFSYLYTLLVWCCCYYVDGKYHLLPNGDLLIHNLEHNDRFASYRCRTMHKLTRLVVISNPSKISINGERKCETLMYTIIHFNRILYIQ